MRKILSLCRCQSLHGEEGGIVGKGAVFEFFQNFLVKFPTLGTGKLFKSNNKSLSAFKKTAVWGEICGQNPHDWDKGSTPHLHINIFVPASRGCALAEPVVAAGAQLLLLGDYKIHTNHMLSTLGFTGSEHWAPLNFPQITALHYTDS